MNEENKAFMDDEGENLNETPQAPQKPKTFKEKAKAGFLETFDTILFVVVAVIIIRTLFGELRWIPSGSMIPTLVEKDRVFVEKMTRVYRPLQRGDVIVFYPPDVVLKNNPVAVFTRLTGIFCKDIAYIKRIIGMPGDTLQIRENEDGTFDLYINGARLNEPYINSNKGWTKCSETVNCGPIKIPEGEFFMMGDNRGNSQDSRYWGTLKKSRIIGHASFIFWPIKRAKMLGTIRYKG